MKVNFPEKDGRGEDLKFNNKYGHYLINHFSTWHGGIHIEGANKPVHAIADGRIIAYRLMKNYEKLPLMPDTVYSDNTTQSDQGTGADSANKNLLYSNCFILVQHDLLLTKQEKENEDTEEETVTTKKKYVTFYSLYNHLMPVKNTEDTKDLNAPKIFGKEDTVVTANEGYEYEVQGLNARKENSNGTVGAAQFIVPFGEKVTVIKDSTDNSILKKKPGFSGKFIKVKCPDKDGVIHDNMYIHTSSKYIKKDEGDEDIYHIITYKEDKKPWREAHSELGARVRHIAHKDGVIKAIIPKDKKVTIEDKNGDWYRIKGYDGYCHKSGLRTKTVYDNSKFNMGSIVACDIPVKSGDLLGYTGKMQSKLDQEYDAVQVDVFMADGVEAFLGNEFGAGEEHKNYIKLPSGTKLKGNLKVKVDLKKHLEVKIIDMSAAYAQIKVVDKIVRTITVKDTLWTSNAASPDGKYHGYEHNGRGYKIIDFDKVNTIFNGLLTEGQSKIIYEVFPETKDATRTVQFKPPHAGESYWVKISDLDKVCKTIKKTVKKKRPVPVVDFKNLLTFATDYSARFEEYEVEVEEYKEVTVAKGDSTILSNDILTAYLEKPDFTAEEEVELCKDAIVDLRKAKKIEVDGKTWINVTCSYYVGNVYETKKGWIQNKKFNTFSPYNWKKFGFNTFNGGSEYMYDIKDLREHPDMDSAFVKAFWGNLNSTRDDVLDIYEVKASYNIKETRQDIARMVCKHKIEWSYTKEEVSTEVTKFYDFLISKEDPGIKDALEGLVKQELDAMKVQVSKLMFWNEAAGLASPPPKEEKEESKVQISRGFRGHPELSIMRRDDKFSAEMGEAYTLPDSSSSAPAPAAPDVAPASGDTKEENPKPPGRIFPQNPNVYHFHPIAFVNQMRLMFPQGDCVAEARVRAFMRMLREGEGTEGEEGYTTAFGGNKITDLSKHPEKDYGGSTAAGAYQIMRYTWWELNGHEVVKENGVYKKTGKYLENKDYVKKYNIPDYSPLSQDKLCLIYMKHYKSGLIELITKGQIETAIRSKASLIWASLPHKGDNSRYKFKGKLQPATPMKQCLEDYRNFFQKEMKGDSDLHLQKGFLKQFGFDCCNEETNEHQVGAPWMKIVLDEYETYKGLKEWDSPLKERIKEYHNTTKYNKGDGPETAWCSSFVNWAMEKSGYKGTKSSKSLDWKDWGKITEIPVYGAIAVKTRKGGGHVGFVYAKNGDKGVVILGGNQTDELKKSNYVDKTIFTYIVPTDYKITGSEELNETNKKYENNTKED